MRLPSSLGCVCSTVSRFRAPNGCWAHPATLRRQPPSVAAARSSADGPSHGGCSWRCITEGERIPITGYQVGHVLPALAGRLAGTRRARRRVDVCDCDLIGQGLIDLVAHCTRQARRPSPPSRRRSWRRQTPVLYQHPCYSPRQAASRSGLGVSRSPRRGAPFSDVFRLSASASSSCPGCSAARRPTMRPSGCTCCSRHGRHGPNCPGPRSCPGSDWAT